MEANRKIQDSHPDYESYKSSGRFVYKEYSKNEIKELINLIEDRAEGAIYTAITFYGLGGAVLDFKNERQLLIIEMQNLLWDSNLYGKKQNMLH